MTNTALTLATGEQLHGLTEREMKAALREHNPDAAPTAVQEMAKILAVVGRIVAAWPQDRRRDIARSAEPLRAALVHLATSEAPRTRVHIEPAGKTEVRQGSGLGERISLEEGKARLDRYAQARPLESWAGPVAGAVEIERDLKIARSTLGRWQQRGAIVGLLRGERKLAYPLEQFVDARPIEGIADVLTVITDPRAAWLWMRQPHAALEGRTPLSVLASREGRDRVVQTAKRDFS